MKQARDTIAAITVALIATAVLHLAGQYSWLRAADNLVSDLVQIHFSPYEPPSDDIVIVAIDEQTLSTFPYRSPIDRLFLAELIETIDSADPKVIAVDLIIDSRTERQKDDRLINALNSSKATVYVAYGTRADGLTESQREIQSVLTTGLNRVSVTLARDPVDGVVRHFLSVRREEGQSIPSLAAVLAGTPSGVASDKPVRLAYPSEGRRDVGGHFAIYPAHSVGLLPAEWFKDKSVLIGVVLEPIDRYRTPFVATYGDDVGSLPGIVIHAFAADQLRRGLRIFEPGTITRIAISFALCLAATVLLRLKVPILARIGLVAGLPIAYGVLACLVYSGQAILLPIVFPTSASMVATAAFGALLWSHDRREKAFIRNAWSRYVSPKIVEQIIANPAQLRLGGEQKVVTYLFTDVADFTNLAEGLSPEHVARILNPYLDGICDVLREKGGTIDKIVGDAVVGLFGAPLDMDRHEQSALDAALEIDRFCTEYSARLNKEGIPFGETRIGVNSGSALVGNFGGTSFFDYTGLGDTVNIAARLEAANKICGTRICVSRSTRDRIEDIAFRPIGKLSLAGKGHLVEAFEPVPDMTEDHLAEYVAAYAELEAGSETALRLFERLVGQFPDDRLANAQLARLRKSDRISAEIETSGSTTGFEQCT